MNRKLKVHELQRPDVATYRESPKLPVVVVLDNIRSFHNVGSIFRTADAFAVEHVVLTGITPRPPHREIHKTALGATDSVTWSYEHNTLAALQHWKEKGYTSVAIEQTEQSTSLQEHAWKESKYLLVLGNEVFGIQQEVVDACTLAWEVPQSGTKHSINVSVCAGIVMWEAYRHLSIL